MIENTIFVKNREGKKASVCSLAFPSTELVEQDENAGFYALPLAGEHGEVDSVECVVMWLPLLPLAGRRVAVYRS